MTTTETLKPCAHCGSSNLKKHTDDEIGGIWADQISCLDCGICVHGYNNGFMDDKELTKAWNRRVND